MWFWERDLLNVRFAPKATELVRVRVMTRCATTGHPSIAEGWLKGLMSEAGCCDPKSERWSIE
jgi:hypothetical protein